ncbi:flavin-binding family monooxygenase domain protein [Mycobacterium xenopi 3993]|nr:flavin-binding family monooxygenase domain protein [Mycobacterium xenopi 3993]
MKWWIRQIAIKNLPEGYDVDTHFKPRYNPWDQRLCLIPDADLYVAISEGRAEVVTDHIDHFDTTGIVLKSGAHLDADIIVTATGLQLQALGGVTLSLDGRRSSHRTASSTRRTCSKTCPTCSGAWATPTPPGRCAPT